MATRRLQGMWPFDGRAETGTTTAPGTKVRRRSRTAYAFGAVGRRRGSGDALVGSADGGAALGVGEDPGAGAGAGAGAGVVGDGDVVGVDPVVACPADEHGVVHGGGPARRPCDEVV